MFECGTVCVSGAVSPRSAVTVEISRVNGRLLVSRQGI